MRLWILTESKYPDNSAPSARIHMLSKAFSDMGIDVTVYSRTPQEDGSSDGIRFISLRGESENRIKQIYAYCITMYTAFIRKVKQERPEAVLVYNAPSHLLIRLIQLKRKYGFLLLHDSVEWYSKEEFRHPYLAKQYLEREFWMRFVLPGRVRVIAISRFLQKYFTQKGNPCVYFPAVCDTQRILFQKKTGERVVIAYAGNPGRKDSFHEILKALGKLTQEERNRVTLRIIGATIEQLPINAQVSVEEIEALGDCVQCLGRMTHDEVYEQLSQADFTILIRPEHLRYAQAGFPTKVPESLASGTPVICNISSDLGEYLQDGKNAIIIRNRDADSIADAIRRAIKTTPEQRKRMYGEARRTAEACFDYRLYVEALKKII